MIYTSTYNLPHRGTAVSISYKLPANFLGDRLKFFCPNEKIITDWAKSQKSQEYWDNFYVPQMQKLIQANWGDIEKWLNNLRPEIDFTLLSYGSWGQEPYRKRKNKKAIAIIDEASVLIFEEDYRHRQLIGELIYKIRPDCWGGEITEAIPQPVPLNGKTYESFTHLPNIGDPLEVFSCAEQTWLKGITNDIYVPLSCKTGKFTYIEVAVDNPYGKRILNAYSLSQIRKQVNDNG